MATIFGSAIKRREDHRLITGSATYTDDVKLPGLTYAAILRSPYAHARITRIDPTAARRSPGVSAIYTGAEIKDRVAPVPCAWNVPNCDLKVPPHPLLAHDKVRYVGDGVAMVVASLFFDGTALPMAGGIALAAVLAFVLTQATVGRRRRQMEVAAPAAE